MKFWKISIVDNNFTVKLLCVAENPHLDSVKKINASVNCFSTISTDKTFKIWKLNEAGVFECSISASYKNDPINSLEFVNDSIYAVVNNTLVCWEKLQATPVSFYNLPDVANEIFYPGQGKDIMIYSSKI